jgi:carboxymethylenebutenolidase
MKCSQEATLLPIKNEYNSLMKTITFNRPDGKVIEGYYAEPPNGSNAPGVVVIQEWWGLNDQIKGMANRLAAVGYRALVPDLYRGRVTVEAQEAQHLMGHLNFGDAAGQDIRGAVQHLKRQGSKVGVTGFCMGGALTLLAAVNVPEADAAASWYGFPPLEYIDTAKIKMPLQGHFAKDDAFFPVSGLDALEKKLTSGGVKFEFYRYDAGHAFANETGAHYKREAAELAWGRMLEFFGKTLGN